MRIDFPRASAVLVLGIMITGCRGNPVPEPPIPHTTKDVDAAIAHMAESQAATGAEWARLHQLLASTAAMDPAPHLQANVALALSLGERSSEELQRARMMMETLLRDSSGPEFQARRSPALSPQMRQLVSVQYEQLLRRIEFQRELSAAELSIDRTRAKLAVEAAAHAKTRQQRDKAFAELDGAREQLRAVTRIELKHQSSGG